MAELMDHDLHVETGWFGADMEVSLINDGPVTLILDTEECVPAGWIDKRSEKKMKVISDADALLCIELLFGGQ